MRNGMTAESAWPRHGESPHHLTSPVLSTTGLHHLFTTRHFPGIRPWRDAAGPFADESAPLFRACGLGSDGIAYLRQVHGVDVVNADRPGLAGAADVIVTDRPGLPLAIFTADCLPLVVYDAANRRLAMAHAGWRGTASGAARVAVAALVERGGDPASFAAAIGPSIGPCCYEVDGPVIERLADAFRGHVDALGDGRRPGEMDARSLAGQRGSAPRGRPRRRAHRQPAAVHGMPGGSVLLVPAPARRRTAWSPSPPSLTARAERARIWHRMDDRDIPQNLERVREAIAEACARSGRSVHEVLLIGVSKTVEAERIRVAVAAGVPALGENRVQEAKEKIEALGHPVPWHLIGHLQTNKARDAARLFDWIHSVDRLELAQELDRRARAIGRTLQVLLEVNVGEEPQKSGVRPDDLKALLDAMAGLGALQPARSHGDPSRGVRSRGHASALPPAARAPRSGRAPASLDGHERGLRRGDRGGRDDGARGHRHLRSPASARPPA